MKQKQSFNIVSKIALLAFIAGIIVGIGLKTIVK